MRIVARAVRPLVAGALVLALVGCTSGTAAQQKLTVTGSTTILPIAETSADMYQAAHPGSRILVAGVGSSQGIESVSSGTSDIGTSSRELAPEEKGLGLVDTKIALDAIAVLVNPANPVRALSVQQVAAIFEGRIKNWRDVGGLDMPIGLVNRDEASGTRDAFSKIVLKGHDFDRTAAVLPGTGQVRAVVTESPGAVGYISLGFVDRGVKPLAIDHVVPREGTVADGTYPISRVLHFFTKGAPKGLAKAYIDFVLSKRVQDEVVRDAGFLPIASAAK